MPKGYVPKAVEAAWYEWWQQRGFFKPDPDSGEFCTACTGLPPGLGSGAGSRWLPSVARIPSRLLCG